MNPILLALLPDGMLIALGAYLRRTVSAQAWAQLDKLNFQILFPALIFSAASGRATSLSDLAMMGAGVWGVIFLGFLFALLLRPWGPEKFLDFAGLWQTAWRFNAAIALVAVQALPPETAALMSVAIGCAVPVANLLAVGALSRGTSMPLAKTVMMVATNPFLLASLAGVIVALNDLHIPVILDAFVSRLAYAAVPLALLSIGASLDFGAFARLNLFQTGLNAIKLLLLPLSALALTSLLQMPPAPAAVLIIFAALPTASAAHVMASAFGADRGMVANLIAQSTLLGCLSLPFWVAVAVHASQ
ncbi:AEC family transporter [Pelagimonas sp. KU-00592-HH]|jgi:predicted permease|uniref:AEC family transporter n=1 Tax=Pelagimonas sp. KU-00592-HH TaxID=3127651 RepID=UPI0031098164